MEIGVTLLVLAGFFFALYGWGRRKDPRMLRNGVFLTIGVSALALLGLIVLASVVPFAWTLVIAAMFLVPVAVLILSIALIANGIVMLRHEGRRLGNLLSLISGVLILVVPAILFGLFSLSRIPYPLNIVAASIGFFIVFIIAYYSLAFVSFAFYSIVYGRMSRKVHPSAIIVLGSGLINGAVSPLLRSRLDRALQIYGATAAEDTGRPIVVPSGGQGSDESRPEGQAMAEYLLEQGADPADVYPEEKSRTTWENIRFSESIISRADRMDECVVVTNNYHVLRAASLTRRAGINATVVGSPTARYFVPSAFIREFIAIIVQYRLLNGIACSPLIIAAALWLVLSL